MNDPALYKVPPQALEVEDSVLALCILFQKQAAEAFEELTPEDFYRTAHQKIFRAMQKMAKADQEIDLPVLVDTLRNAEQMEEVGGVAYLTQLTDVPIPASIQGSIKVLQDKRCLRELIQISNETIKRCFDGGDVEEVLNQAQAQILGIDHRLRAPEAIRIGDLMDRALDRWEELSQNKGISGISTGYIELDELTFGLQDSDLIVLAGRPSMGKTALLVNMATKQAEAGVKVGVFSLEQANDQLADRAMAMEGGINSTKFRSGQFDQSDWMTMTDALGRMVDWPLFFDDSGSLHYQDIRKRARVMVRKHGIQVIYIDYLGFIRGDFPKNREQDVGSITRALKGMAKELGIPVILLAQLNRKVEERPNKRPRLSDLRDSGNIEQDADLVMFIYRDEVYYQTEDGSNKGLAEVNIEKHRNGPTGQAKLFYEEHLMRFSDLSLREEGPTW
ncbi:MAG: replicative DNA helicase [Thermoplasmata archaeon]|nr:replicative DNA helicase [Thermoplasmata archaeon]